MATLGELMEKFAAASDETPEAVAAETPEPAVVTDGTTKIASGGEGMKSLTDIYLALTETDFEKEAAEVAEAPEQDVDFAKMAEELADIEADEIIEEEADETDMTKVAAEYDAAGRIMARGFYDEFNKLAGTMDTDVAPNQMTESETKAETPALGPRGLPTVPTNFAGNEAHDQKIETTGSGPKLVNADALKEKKSIRAGVTGDDAPAAAAAMGNQGFATVQDLTQAAIAKDVSV